MSGTAAGRSHCTPWCHFRRPVFPIPIFLVLTLIGYPTLLLSTERLCITWALHAYVSDISKTIMKTIQGPNSKKKCEKSGSNKCLFINANVSRNSMVTTCQYLEGTLRLCTSTPIKDNNIQNVLILPPGPRGTQTRSTTWKLATTEIVILTMNTCFNSTNHIVCLSSVACLITVIVIAG